MNKQFVVNGVDSYTKEDNEAFWERKKAEKNGVVLRTLGVSTSDACNLNCVYCYAQGQMKEARSSLSLEEQCSLIDQARELGTSSMLICGNGEPTVDRNLLKMIEHASEKGIV